MESEAINLEEKLEYQTILNKEYNAILMKLSDMTVNNSAALLENTNNIHINIPTLNDRLDKNRPSASIDMKLIKFLNMETGLEESSILSSPGSFSSYSLGSCSSPGYFSPPTIFSTNMTPNFLQTYELSQAIPHSLALSSDSGITDVDDSTCKTNSDDSNVDEDYFERNNCQEQSFDSDDKKSVEILEIFQKGDSEFWYSSDDYEDNKLSTEMNNSYFTTLPMGDQENICNINKKKSHRRKKNLREVSEVQEDDEEKNGKHLKFVNCKLSLRNVYKKMFHKSNTEEMKQFSGPWRGKEEKRRIVRRKNNEKKKLKQIYCKKEVQNVNNYLMLISKKKYTVLSDNFY